MTDAVSGPLTLWIGMRSVVVGFAPCSRVSSSYHAFRAVCIDDRGGMVLSFQANALRNGVSIRLASCHHAQLVSHRQTWSDPTP